MAVPVNFQYAISNLSSMINDNDEGHQEVKDFLVTCRLSQYVDCFIREGFDTLNSICEILEEDMIEMNVKRGHRRLIQREISTAKGIHPNQPLVIKSIRNNGSIDLSRKPGSTANMQLSNRDASSTSSPSNGTSGYGSMSSSSTLFTPNTIMTPKNPDTTDRGMEKHRVNADPVCISTILNDSGASSNEDDSIGAGGNYPPKRTYRRHPRQDVNAPVKPPSAYIMFSNDTRLQLKDKNYSFAELAKTVGDRWKSLSCAEKQAYERTAMRAKDEYAGMLSQYKRTVDYKKYQEYLKEFRSKQLTASRMVSRTRKRRTTESLNSGSMADYSSNGNSNENGSFFSGSNEAYGDKDSNDSQQDGDSEGSNRPRGSDKNGRQTNHDSSASQKSFDLQQLQQYHGHYKEMTLDQATTPAANGRSLCFINPTEQSHNSTPPPPFTTNEKQMIPEYQSAEYMPSSTSQPQKSLQMLSGSSHENKEMVVSFSNPPSNPFSLSWIHGMNSPRSSSKFTVKNTPHTISNNKAMSDTNTYGPPVLEPSLHTHSPILSENQGLGNKMTESEQGTNTRDASLLLKSRHPILLYKPISHSPTKKARAYRHTNDTRPSRMTTRSSKSGSSSH